jgi:ATPase family associated with various cellular activities (AAA)/Winged helix domain, variant
MMPAEREQRGAENKAHLVGAIAAVRAVLEAYVAGGEASRTVPEDDGPFALPFLVRTFALTTFERAVLVMCAACELDASFAELIGRAHGDPARTAPTFGLALAAFGDAHWSALSSARPLRRWRLVEPLRDPAQPLAAAPLRIDERIVNALTDVEACDERLDGIVTPLDPPAGLVPSHAALARRIASALAEPARTAPFVELCGADEPTRRDVVAHAARVLGVRALAFDAAAASRSADLDATLRAATRETLLSTAILYAGVDDDAELRAAERLDAVPLVIGCARRSTTRHRTPLRFDVARPTADEQRALWLDALARHDGDSASEIDELVEHFDLSAAAIGAAAVRTASERGTPGAAWRATLQTVRPHFGDLAQRVESGATWDTLVLPLEVTDALRGIVAHVRHRTLVHDGWGFAGAGNRGRGVAALFAGTSGTGKTTAAEIVARELGFDLYRVDLAGVVSKYIGETEKNLRRLFDAAESGGCVLFFDEAEALFGKRGEIRDGHDRYANIEIDYLLQRIEAFRGVAILATNAKAQLDAAFLRRLRFVVTFAFPDAAQRAQIWARAFPPNAPLAELDRDWLARLELSGGGIRNAALHAAFLAADRGEPIGAQHLREAARAEFAKIERPYTEAP